ncbi:response regulator transcription factor [Oceanisphaera pacifica]|uniref:Response regulator n=1 Tax=Oceanisphaera pacifica TaxID=2818389 RepID=A0ABS3NG08_9GAMM|nr:response regulator [Oceanisphaera pacifica]MBO1519502.1 response regulator [Oceanisphaera pacifica]
MTQANAITLLLVDDSRVARLSLMRQIKSLTAEFDILQAASADEAQQLLTEQDADIALIDFNMPGRDGLVLAAELRESHPNMRMALVTANIQQPLVERAKELGMAFMGKPTNVDDLASFLRVTP